MEKNTAAAIARAAARLRGGVARDATNTHHRYSYVSAEALIGAAGDALSAEGVGTFCSTAYEPFSVPVECGRESALGMLTLTMCLRSASSSDIINITRVAPVVVSPGRPLDKALAAAGTLALRYALRDLLLIPQVDEGEDVAGRHDGITPSKTAKPAPQANPSPPAKPSAHTERLRASLRLACAHLHAGDTQATVAAWLTPAGLASADAATPEQASQICEAIDERIDERISIQVE